MPDRAKIDQARDVLRGLEALDDDNRITPMGTAMAGLPVHPRLAHMMLRGAQLGLDDVACALAALLSDRDFMRGRGADLRIRVEAIIKGRAPKMISEAAKQLARRLRDAVKQGGLAKPDTARVDRADEVGLLLAFAYPDRIGERRKGQMRAIACRAGAVAFYPMKIAWRRSPISRWPNWTGRRARPGFTLQPRWRVPP